MSLVILFTRDPTGAKLTLVVRERFPGKSARWGRSRTLLGEG
jgi:hypothetical protein